MRQLILKMSMSLDGFVSGPDGDNDWMLPSRSEDGAAWVLETIQRAGVHVVGRRTFETWATFWPTSPAPMAAPMNEIPKVVFTRQSSLEPPEAPGWASARIANGDLAEEVQRLKNEPGDYILAQGGAGFARSLVGLGLVDEYRLVVHPVAIGSGLPLFADLPQPLYLELVSTTAFQAGGVAHVYRPVTA